MRGSGSFWPDTAGVASLIAFASIFHVLGMLWLMFSGILMLPVLIDWVTEEPFAEGFFEVALVSAAFAGIVVLASRKRGPFVLRLREAFLLTTLSWVSLPAFAALPLMTYGISFTDGYFEAMSGLTTTGSTVLSGLDDMDPAILFWRALLQWIGGIGIIVMAIVLLPFLRVGGMQLFRTESSDQFDKAVPRASQLTGWIVAIYFALTFACVVAFMAFGMEAFDALCHAMATLSTGGYSTHDASFGHFREPGLHWAATLFMIAGALPFAAYIGVLHGRFDAMLRDTQIRGFIALVLAICTLMTLWLWASGEHDFSEAARLVTFNIVSVITTTGFASTDYQLWGPFAFAVFFVVMFIGGCAGSTSGAIKIYRFQIIAKMIAAQVRRLTSVHRVNVMTYAGKPVAADVPVSILAFVAIFLATIGLGTLLLAATGLDLLTALTASATAITNVGPGLGDVIGPAGNFSGLPDTAKWLLSAAMLLGRLELFTVLVLFNPSFWRG
ncbi:MAG: TrkH family potassium uptake protein [Pseudomonadota bacterium]|nr:TrkH family potassium uptake protein [Pseudomonadota bacterium]